MTNRQPKGTPVGGQFAEGRKPDGGDLNATPDVVAVRYGLGPTIKGEVILRGGQLNEPDDLSINLNTRDVEASELVSLDDDGWVTIRLADGRFVLIAGEDVAINGKTNFLGEPETNAAGGSGGEPPTVVTTFDFGRGPVAAHPHPHGGGWVADTASVAPTVWVAPNARIADNAVVRDQVRDELRMELARVTQERDEKDAECKTLTKENARLVNKSNDWQEVSEILGDQLGSALRERDEALSRIERAKELAKREPRADLDKDAYFNHLQFRDALLAILEGDTE